MKKTLTFRSYRPPLLLIIFGSFLLMTGGYQVYMFVSYIITRGLDSPALIIIVLKIILYLGLGIKLARAEDFKFDFNQSKYTIIVRLGALPIWKHVHAIPTPEYISVFPYKNIYRITLISKHKRIQVSYCDTVEEAKQFSHKLADYLDTDLYDATNPLDKKWLNVKDDL